MDHHHIIQACLIMISCAYSWKSPRSSFRNILRNTDKLKNILKINFQAFKVFILRIRRLTFFVEISRNGTYTQFFWRRHFFFSSEYLCAWTLRKFRWIQNIFSPRKFFSTCLSFSLFPKNLKKFIAGFRFGLRLRTWTNRPSAMVLKL